MKYIRTEDGIWLFGGTHVQGKVVIGKKQEIDFGYCFDKEDIIKQADTIEELCDEFVIEYPSGELDTLNHDYSARLKYMGMEQYNAEINHGWCKLYGAIWTDKGLIYVAKMNEKGELELL